MKTKALFWSLSGLMLIGMLCLGGALCSSFSADDDWTLSQAQTQADR